MREHAYFSAPNREKAVVFQEKGRIIITSCVSGKGMYNYYHKILFCHPKNLDLALVSGKFSEMGAGTNKAMKDGCSL